MFKCQVVLKTVISIALIFSISVIPSTAHAVETDETSVSGLSADDFLQGTITCDLETYTYTGQAIVPRVEVRLSDGTLLASGQDYTLLYFDAAGNRITRIVEEGTYTIAASGLGAYSGMLTTEITVEKIRATWTRLAGSDRYATMSAIVSEAFADDSSSYVIVCTGESFPDALSASALAGMLDAPIVLTSNGSLTEQARYEVRRTGAAHVIVIGGTPSVSAQAADQLQSLSTVEDVTRISGTDRYATSLSVLRNGSQLGSWSDTVIITTGERFPDALSMSPYAYATNSPVVLVDSSKLLSTEAVQAIQSGGFTRAIVLGDTNSVSDGIQNQLGSGIQVVRLAGSDRYLTSLEIASFAMSEGTLRIDGVAITTGERFPDALAGAALCGSSSSVILLVGTDSQSQQRAINCISENLYEIEQGYVLGDTASVSAALLSKIEALWD